MSKTVSFVCVHCGFPRRLSPTYIKLIRSVKCGACKRTDGWVKAWNAPKKVLSSDLWKKLLIAENHHRYKNGRFEFTKEFKQFKEYLEEDLSRRNDKKGKELFLAYKVLFSYDETDGFRGGE